LTTQLLNECNLVYFLILAGVSDCQIAANSV